MGPQQRPPSRRSWNHHTLIHSWNPDQTVRGFITQGSTAAIPDLANLDSSHTGPQRRSPTRLSGIHHTLVHSSDPEPMFSDSSHAGLQRRSRRSLDSLHTGPQQRSRPEGIHQTLVHSGDPNLTLLDSSHTGPQQQSRADAPGVGLDCSCEPACDNLKSSINGLGSQM